MEDGFQGLQAWCWRSTENVRNYPGLHFTARPASCDVLSAFLHHFQDVGGTRTVPLRPLDPREEAKITGGQRFRCFRKLRIEIEASSERLRQMSFREEDGIVYFHFTPEHVGEFLRGVTDVRNGTGDYSIAPFRQKRLAHELGELDRLSESLWFWPCFGHIAVVE